MRLWRKSLFFIGLPLLLQIAIVGGGWFAVWQSHSDLERELISSATDARTTALLRSTSQIQSTIFGLLVLSLGAAAALAYRLFLDISKSLRALHRNADNISHNRTVAPAMKGDDEFSQIDRAIRQVRRSQPSQMPVMRSFSRKAADVICAIDTKYRVTSVNPACRAVWGYSPEELIGRSLFDIIKHDARETTLALERCRESKTSSTFENLVQCSSGREADMLWSTSWSEPDQAYCCVVHDISEAKQVARMKRDFVQMMSHDLRAPLTSLSNVLIMTTEGVFGHLNDAGRNSILRSQAELERLIRMINDLLDLDRMEEKKMQLELAPYELSFLVEHSLDAVEGLAAERQISVACRGEASFEVMVDADRIVQLIINLLSNAIKFSEPGASVYIETGIRDSMALIRVIDTGCGIAPDQLKLVFDRFRQVQSAAKKKSSSGLGLAISKTIVEEHGGEIGVESTPGMGSTFWFTLATAAKQAHFS